VHRWKQRLVCASAGDPIPAAANAAPAKTNVERIFIADVLVDD
jgi:hypothetical protein